MILKFNRIYLLTVLISIILAVYFIVSTSMNQYIGVIVTIDSEHKIIISEIDENAFGASIDLQEGDQIISINGRSPLEHKQVVKHRRLEQAESFVIERKGIIKEFEIREFSGLDSQSLFQLVIPTVVFILCLFCSHLIYRTYKINKNLQLKSAFLLNCFLLALALAYLSGGMSARGDEFGRYVNLSLFLIAPVLYLHFIYQYFKEVEKLWFSKSYLSFSYFIACSNILIEFIRDLLFISIVFIKTYNLFSFFLLIIVIIYLKLKGLRKVNYSEQKYMIRILLISNIAAFLPFTIFFVVPYIFWGEYVFPPIVLAAFLLLIPLSLIYQFISTKIYDIEFLLGRLKYYSLLAVIPSFIIVAVLHFMKNSNSAFLIIKQFLFIFFFLLVIFYIKEILDFRFRLKRFSEKYNYQGSVLKYTQSIRKASNLEQVISELKRVITDVLLVSRAYFIEIDKEKNIVSLDVNAVQSDYIPYEEKMKETASVIGKIVELDRGFIINIGETKERTYILLCLSILNTPRLTRDEISWLQTLSFYTNVSLENFLKIEELMVHLQKIEKEGTNPSWLTKLLFSLEEKQRSNLAKDLHDSVLQDLVSLKRQCECALAAQEDIPLAITQRLEEMNSKMTDIIKTTRETCQELRPQLLYDLGLIKALNKLVGQYQEFVSFDIRLNTGNFQVNLDLDVQLNIYRIIQELLTNAHKYSYAANVLIMLVCIKGKIILHYEDDGDGVNEEELYLNTKGMGLSGISERVKALNGVMKIETSEDKGFKVDIEI
ncbi:histidine kinase [Metabacillus fastidiosus]|uniref:histidine kinase n=1 Tax=Metabacillus fastidiosus TaxID=1458 RepID=UPI003D29514F